MNPRSASTSRHNPAAPAKGAYPIGRAMRRDAGHTSPNWKGTVMAKGKVPPQLIAHQFKPGSAKAASAGAKGGKTSSKSGGKSKSGK